LVQEWHWDHLPQLKSLDGIQRYLVDEARVMNLNSFRTHTGPPPHSWLDVADENGIFFLAEFPILYNGANFRFTKEECDAYHANALMDAEAWVTELGNHPSIAIWALSNE